MNFILNVSDKVFMNKPSKICKNQSLKKLPFFKVCPPQVSIDPFFNTLSHTSIIDCKTCYHRNCYVEGKCGRCQRIQARLADKLILMVMS